MTDRNRILGLGGLALALVVAAGLAVSPSTSLACGQKAATKTASVVPASNSGACTSAQKAGGCPAAAMAGCTAHGASAAGCSGAAVKTAEVSLPEGTKVERKDVDGGVDFVFTSSDLKGVEGFLAAHLAACKDADKSMCGETCTVTTTEDSHVILQVRGKDAASCHMSTMLVSYMDEQVGDKAAATKS